MRETGKQRSQRIQIDYYRRRGGLDRLRNACILVGLVGAGAYAAYVLASGGGAHTSTGPLARAHAAFEQDCQACHEDFVPIDSQAVKIDLELAGIQSSKSIAHLESACQRCHRVGDHFRARMHPDGQLLDQNCGLCHAEHRGRDHDLVHVANQQCVSCHDDLARVCAAAPKIRAKISAFTSAAHGDFSSLQIADPGRIKFDHAQHMLAGQVNAGEKGAFTLAMLDPAVRERYRQAGQDNSAPIQLDCDSCHEYAGNPAGVDTLSFDQELGRYLAPVSFQQHCSACHAMHPGVATADTTPLPHAVAWSKVDLLLRASIVGARASPQARLPRDDTQSSPLPGEGPGTSSVNNATSTDAELAAARQRVESQCLKCHDASAISDQAIADAAHSPPMIPPRWLKLGLYDHGAHRKIECRFCHQSAYAGDGSPQPPTDHQTVMIGGIETCTPCHRDAELPTPGSITSPQVAAMLGEQTTWAPDNCILCHRYHSHRDGAMGIAETTSTENGQ